MKTQPLKKEQRLPTTSYLTITGERQGLISSGASTEGSAGNGWQLDREDQILVQAMSHGVSLPKGKSSGHRMHKPLVITKAIDKSTPLLMSAVCTGERLKSCRLDMYRPSSTGGLEKFFTLEFEDAVITDFNLISPHCQDPAAAGFTQLERVEIAYRAMTYRHEICGTMASDDWREGDGA